MGIISKTSSGVQAQPKPFPKLMINLNTGSVLLMTNLNTGTVLIQSSVFPVGFHGSDLRGNFTDYEGTVSLSNE